LEVIVEVGTEEQKDLIKSEIYSIYGSLDELDISIDLYQVIIPIDFEKTIRDLSGNKSYTQCRGQVAIAKIVNVPQGVSIVFSPWIYNEQYDYQVRVIWYIHELFHAINKKRFPSRETDYVSKNIFYLDNMYPLFDEYYANRKSFCIVEVIAKPRTFYLNKFINTTFSGHVKSLLNYDYYSLIKKQIYLFRLHGNVRHFIDQVSPFYDEASKDIVYAYSYIDHFSKLKRIEPLLSKSEMVNNKAIVLIDYFRNKYATDDFNLEDGLEIMEEYMTNFGMRFKDTPEGLYCSVIDI
jgi:hypothetical protein